MPSEGPFYSLRVGDLVAFELFQDVPPQSVKLRGGVILSIEVQIAETSSEEPTAVQTVLGIVSQDSYDSGKREIEEQVFMRDLQKISVDMAYRTLTGWHAAAPSLKGSSRPHLAMTLEEIDAQGKSKPYTFEDMRRQMSGKTKRRKTSTEGLAPSTPYLSPVKR